MHIRFEMGVYRFAQIWARKAQAKRATQIRKRFVPGTTAEARAAKWVVPQWEVLAAGRAGWDGGLKKVRVNESRGNSGEQE